MAQFMMIIKGNDKVPVLSVTADDFKILPTSDADNQSKQDAEIYFHTGAYPGVEVERVFASNVINIKEVV